MAYVTRHLRARINDTFSDHPHPGYGVPQHLHIQFWMIMDILQETDPAGIAYSEYEYSNEARAIEMKMDRMKDTNDIRERVTEVFKYYLGAQAELINPANLESAIREIAFCLLEK